MKYGVVPGNLTPSGIALAKTMVTQGLPGAPGPTGSSGFSRTTATLMQPAVGSNVTVSLSDAAWVSVGQTLWLMNVGTYLVAATSGSSVTLTNLGGVRSTLPGTLTGAGVFVSPTGEGTGSSAPGPTGATGPTGPTGPPGPTGAAGPAGPAGLGTLSNGTFGNSTHSDVIVVAGTHPVSVSSAVISTPSVTSRASGPFASRPAPGNSGALYYCTDLPFVYVDSGSAWQVLFHNENIGVPPALSGYTAYGTNACARTEGDVILADISPNDAAFTATNIAAFLQPASLPASTPWIVEFAGTVSPQATWSTCNVAAGMVVSNGNTLGSSLCYAAHCFLGGTNSGFGFSTFTLNGAVQTSYGTIPLQMQCGYNLVRLRILNDGTYLNGQFSLDGRHWAQMDTGSSIVGSATFSYFGFFVGNPLGNNYHDLASYVLRNRISALNVPQTAITAVGSSANPLVASASHGLRTGDLVNINGVGGATGVNGQQLRVVVADANSFYVNVGAPGAYTSGGTVTCASR
jgi:hypothetical protein